MPLPLTIAVNDFFGAVLLGLFTHSMGKWVYQKLFETDDEADDSTTNPASNTGKAGNNGTGGDTPSPASPTAVTGAKDPVPVGPIPTPTDPNAQSVGALENNPQ